GARERCAVRLPCGSDQARPDADHQRGARLRAARWPRASDRDDDGDADGDAAARGARPGAGLMPASALDFRMGDPRCSAALCYGHGDIRKILLGSRRASESFILIFSITQGALGLASGALVGFSLGLIGGGGSILAVPLMVYVVGVSEPHVAIGTSAI